MLLMLLVMRAACELTKQKNKKRIFDLKPLMLHHHVQKKTVSLKNGNDDTAVKVSTLLKLSNA